MIQFKTNNNETHIAVGVPDDAYDINVEFNPITEWYDLVFASQLRKYELNTINLKLNEEPEILGTFDKAKNEVDFNVNRNWVADFFSLNYSLTVSSYLSQLQSVTKESKENKFVIIKKI